MHINNYIMPVTVIHLIGMNATYIVKHNWVIQIIIRMHSVVYVNDKRCLKAQEIFGTPLIWIKYSMSYSHDGWSTNVGLCLIVTGSVAIWHFV